MKDGWLKKALDDAQKEYDSLPKWMRDRMDMAVASNVQKREDKPSERKSYSDICWLTGTGGYGQ